MINLTHLLFVTPRLQYCQGLYPKVQATLSNINKSNTTEGCKMNLEMHFGINHLPQFLVRISGLMYLHQSKSRIELNTHRTLSLFNAMDPLSFYSNFGTKR